MCWSSTRSRTIPSARWSASTNGPYQLVSEVRTPVPRAPGHPERYDYEYRRCGTANVFLCFQPLLGWRHVEVTERRTALDFAHQMKALVDLHFPEAERIRVVLDNLSTHTPWALYQAFEAAEARRIVRRLEFHYTPKHASWLDMAEIELSILSRTAIKGRIPDEARLIERTKRFQESRNARRATINWTFTKADARRALKYEVEN